MPAAPSPRTSSPPKNATPATSKPATPAPPPMKPANFGKAIGIDKPANVRAKIAKWQQDLEGDSPAAESAAASSSTPSPKLQPTPKAGPLADKSKPTLSSPKGTYSPKFTLAASPEKALGPKKPAHNVLDDDLLSATKPKKRVVSDSHWRKKGQAKDAAGRSPPKQVPNAWVRPAARRAAGPSEPKEACPTKPDAKPAVKLGAKEASGRQRSARRRRPSQPSGSENEKRPSTSGSGSSKTDQGASEGPGSLKPRPKSSQDYELVRVRRRRRSGPSPRASLSTEDVSQIKRHHTRSETIDVADLANLITVEYDESVAPDDIRERRRRSRRKDYGQISVDDSPREPLSADRRRHHRSAHASDAEDAVRKRSPEPSTPVTPTAAAPAASGNRLQAWLQATPDPIVKASSPKRRKSKDSIPKEEAVSKPETSEISASSTPKEPSSPKRTRRKSDSKRRERSSRESLHLDTQNLGEPAPSETPKETSSPQKKQDNESTSTTTPTLKRRGAKRAHHSPTKERHASTPQPPPTVTDADEVSLAPSSSVDASTVDFEPISPERTPRLDPPPMRLRPFFPSNGKRLSTIASVETFTTKLQNAAPSEAVGSEAAGALGDQQNKGASVAKLGEPFNADAMSMLSRRSTKRGRLASHADLISVLSMPRAGAKSIVSARSIRTNRSRLATATMSDILTELASDETKYMRELRTLVDGVIPVLLSCVLSKSESAVAAGLFSRSSKIDPSDVTKPIVDMGISLERLKSLHRRIPKDDPDAFLSWATSAQRIYSDYISVWRLGFEDVVVNLAPADEDPFTPAKVVQAPSDAAPWDEGLPRNAEGYVVNGDGERVDVAYMLKRPLVRLKYLAKTMRGINHVKPSEQAEKMSDVFQDLVIAARKRSNDERARLEDEAAANIDPTRARDPRSLAPLAGVRIDPTRCVRARDYFDMHLLHSSGQEVNCQVELLLRDNGPGSGAGGDLLLCEVDAKGRWLFLPPIQHSRVSARNGDRKGEIVVMIRGQHGDGSEWSEVLSLNTDDEQTGFEWVQMLGLQPVPPQISELKRDPSILIKAPPPASSYADSSAVSAVTASTPPHKSRTPSPHEIEIPIGEQAGAMSKRWGYDTPGAKSRNVSPISPPSTIDSVPPELSHLAPVPHSPISERQLGGESGRSTPIRPTSQDEEVIHRTPRSLNDAMRMAGNSSPVSLKRTKAKRISKALSSSNIAARPRPSRQIVVDDPEEPEGEPEPEPLRKKPSKRHSLPPPASSSSSMSQPRKNFSVWIPSSDAEYSDESESDDDASDYPVRDMDRPQNHRRVSSVPSLDLPTIPKIRKTSQPTTPDQEYFDDEESYISTSTASKLEDIAEHSHRDTYAEEDDDRPPPVPVHRSPSPASPVTLKTSQTPVLTPTLGNFRNNKRRSSSPLKHEYAPSTASESSTESEEEYTDSEDVSTMSESTDGELDDAVPMPLMPAAQTEQFPKVSPPGSIYTLPNGTITPSQSASNTPYRAVPQDSGKAAKAIASIYTWSDEGHWDSLHPEECSVVVTPGKIQVFEMTAAHSQPFLADGDDIIAPESQAPLIALELTPLVPMRKSTAIDITIRSPPTEESIIKGGNNIMLRSRNPGECAQLYAMINQSRINNPTYIALQNARGPYGQGSWAEAMDRQNAARPNPGSSKSLFSGTLGRRSSYRKTSTRAASVSAVTESSVGTMNSALRSALSRFTFGKNGRWNIRGSTLGSRSLNSFDTGSSGSGSGNSSPFILPEAGRAAGAPAGITNTKCRLYERDALSSKWRDMGAARLTIMLPDPLVPQGAMRQGKGSFGTRDPSQEKRIMVTGKSNGETMLDATLGESCFERVARSGIAVSVWEDVMGTNGELGSVGAKGGVSGARARVFMIQMKSERECAYCFSLLGKQRY